MAMISCAVMVDLKLFNVSVVLAVVLAVVDCTRRGCYRDLIEMMVASNTHNQRR